MHTLDENWEALSDIYYNWGEVIILSKLFNNEYITNEEQNIFYFLHSH